MKENENIKHLNPKRVKVEGRFKILNIISDVNRILPKELKLKPNQQLILFQMWSHADENNVSIISNQTISLNTNLTIRTVETHVPELVRLGWIEDLKSRYNNSKVRRLVIPDKVMDLIEEDLTFLNETEKNNGLYRTENISVSENISSGTENISSGTEKNNGLTEQYNRTDNRTVKPTEKNNVANAPSKTTNTDFPYNIYTETEIDSFELQINLGNFDVVPEEFINWYYNH